MAAKKQTKTKSKKRQVNQGKIYISASFNNTLITVTDLDGSTIKWGSAGKVGFKGTRKATPYAATTAVEQILREVQEEYGLKEAEIYIKGPGPGRDASLRAIKSVGIDMILIADVTPIPHDGPRPKKKRRV